MTPVRKAEELRASFRQIGEDVDAYRIWVDGPVLRIHASGLWDVAVARSYVQDISRIITELRRAAPHLRAIVDRSDAPIFGEGVSEILLATYGRILRPGDRVAMIVDSSLVKGHIRRIADREGTQSFLSISSAQTWVLAYG